MPIIKSAKKRVSTAKKASVRNSKTKRSLKSAVKAFHAAVTGKSKTTGTALSKAQSEIDKAAKKNVIHKNKAARKKSQLARAAKASGIGKPTAAKATAKPAAKPAAKKPAAAKPATAKTATKKPAAKKPAAKK